MDVNVERSRPDLSYEALVKRAIADADPSHPKNSPVGVLELGADIRTPQDVVMGGAVLLLSMHRKFGSQTPWDAALEIVRFAAHYEVQNNYVYTRRSIERPTVPEGYFRSDPEGVMRLTDRALRVVGHTSTMLCACAVIGRVIGCESLRFSIDADRLLGEIIRCAQRALAERR